MTNRYRIIVLASSYARVVDTEAGELVRTNSGSIYEAPKENAQWTADQLNRKDAREKAAQDTADFDQAQAEMAQEAVRLAHPEAFPRYAYEGLPQNPTNLESRLEPTETLMQRLTPMGQAPKGTDWQMAYAHQVGATKRTVPLAEEKVRAALNLIFNGDLNVSKLNSLLESALRSLEAARSSMDANPYV